MPSVEDNDLNSYVNSLSDTLYACAKSSVGDCEERMSIGRTELGRWERLMQNADDARVWRAIDWKGNYSTSVYGDGALPSDVEFRDHFEKILNPAQVTEAEPLDLATNISIPVLDEPISPLELHK